MDFVPRWKNRGARVLGRRLKNRALPGIVLFGTPGPGPGWVVIVIVHNP